MSNYTYRVISKEGKEKTGSIEADTREKALGRLKLEGNTVIELKEGSLLNKDINFEISSKPKSKEFMVFCRQFNALLKAGVSVIESLDMLAEQTENKTLAKSIKTVHDSVQKGDGLAMAMRRETIYPPLLVNMIAAGEASGNLENSLLRMAIHFEKDNKVKQMVKKAMIYPIILLVVAVAVLVVMVVFVLPKFEAMFADLGDDLPVLTRALMDFSGSLTSHWFIYIAVIAVIVVLINLFRRTNTGKHFFAHLAIKLPVFGKLTVKTASARFARTFATMLSSGMPMVEAMNITAKTMDNVLFQEACEDASLAIQQGQSLATPLKKSGLFPSLILHMVGIGEESGNLEEMLDNCAVYYDDEVEQTTQQVMALMEPMIIVVLAVIVCVILASIYGPMIQLYDSLGRV